MPAYKKQHYLPAVYISQFSSDQTIVSRSRSQVWRTDSNGSRLVPVKSECRKNYFYSKKNPQNPETMFQGLENLYPICVKRVRSRTEPTSREHFALMLMMFDLHLRNVAYENRTKGEGLEAYNIRVDLFKREIVFNPKEGKVSDEDCSACLRKHWKIRILDTGPGTEFATSDNPSLWFSTQPDGHLHYVILPITPAFCALAFDTRVVQAVSATVSRSENDILIVNQFQHAHECIYTSSEPNENDRWAFAETRRRTERAHGYVDDRAWSVNYLQLPETASLSFIRVLHPLS